MTSQFSLHKIEEADKGWVLDIVRGWGADFVVSRGRKIYPAEIEGYIAVDRSGEKVGLVTYEIIDDQCEVVTLDAFHKFSGVGTAMLKKVAETASSAGCHRIWLITTNDNLNAIRFYQRRGMTIGAIHVNALERSRQIKSTIPKTGQHGIPLRDEIEFEMSL